MCMASQNYLMLSMRDRGLSGDGTPLKLLNTYAKDHCINFGALVCYITIETITHQTTYALHVVYV